MRVPQHAVIILQHQLVQGQNLRLGYSVVIGQKPPVGNLPIDQAPVIAHPHKQIHLGYTLLDITQGQICGAIPGSTRPAGGVVLMCELEPSKQFLCLAY